MSATSCAFRHVIILAVGWERGGREGWTGPRERENNDCIEKGGRGGVHVRSKTEGGPYYEIVYAC